MADVQIAVIDQQNTQIALAAPSETEVTIAVPGVQGPAGEGVPSGGTANQVLFKQSGTDYDTAWSEITSEMIGDLEIVNADVATNAAIAGTKISPNFGSQNVVTTGTATAAALIPSGSSVPTNGIYSPGADQVAISTGGTGRLFVDANGNVGVGGAASANGLLRLNAAPGLNSNLVFSGSGTDRYLLGQVNDVGALRIYDLVTSSERLRITADGKLGVGTSAPSKKLHVVVDTNDPTTASPSSGSFIQAEGNTATVGNGPSFALANASGAKETYWRISAVTTSGNNGDLVFNGYNGGANYPERLRITASGNVGIGTATADQTLSVGSGAADTRMSINGTGQYQLKFTNSGADGFWVGSPGANSLAFAQNDGTTRMTIDSSGRLGINTASPSYLLTCATSADGVDGVSVESPSVNGIIRLRADGTNGSAIRVGGVGAQGNTLRFLAGGDTERARLDSSGRLLVGTSTARSTFFGADYTSALQVETASVSNPNGLSIGANTNDDNPANLYLFKTRGTSVGSNAAVQDGDILGNISFIGANGTDLSNTAAWIRCIVDGVPFSSGDTTDLPGALAFSTTVDGASTPTERMRLTRHGRLDVFADTPLRPRSSTGAGTSDALLYGSHSATSTTNGTAVYAIWTNGTTQTLSDQRQKKNIETTRSGYLEDLQKLRVVKYHWNTQQDDEPKELGLIAQEVEQVFPGLVSSFNQADETIEDLKGIKTSVIQFMLLKALQEAADKIETLEAKVAALEAL